MVIPFVRDFDFVRRAAIFDKVRYLCGKPSARVALVGLGGIGKSQIALEFAYHTRQQSPETWVFWIHASSAIRYEQGFRKLADRARIRGRQDPQNNIFRLVYNWLDSENSGKWLIVLDNVDDVDFLVDTPSHDQAEETGGASNHATTGANLPDEPLISYIPPCSRGSILITARNKTVALRLVDAFDIVPVDPMNQEDAILLVHQKLADLQNQSDVATNAGELAAALEYMPLAIVQATSYIRQRAPRCSLQSYLEQLQESDETKEGLLVYEREELRLDNMFSHSTILTWQISFNHLHKTAPLAAGLLSLMSFCDRQEIPAFLLRGPGEYLEENEREEEEVTDRCPGFRFCRRSDEEFEEAISALRNLSLIFSNESGSSFSIPGLVQLSMRNWLDTHNQKERWQQEFLRRICSHLPPSAYDNWPIWQVLFPHVKAAVKHRPSVEASLVTRAMLLCITAAYLLDTGDVNGAEQMAVDATESMTKLFGPEHVDTLLPMVVLAYVRCHQSKLDEAEILMTEVLRSAEALNGADDVGIPCFMNTLGSIYLEQGRYDAAEELISDARELANAMAIYNEGDLPGYRTNLVNLYMNQGRYNDAKAMAMEGMEVAEAEGDTVQLLWYKTLLIMTYSRKGQSEKARHLAMDMVEDCTAILGVHHPITLANMVSLAESHLLQGQWEEAEQKALPTMEVMEAQLGANSIDTLEFGTVFKFRQACGGYGEEETGERFTLDVMETWETKFGTEHPRTLHLMRLLASVGNARGYHAEALSLLTSYLERVTRTFGNEHELTTWAREKLSEWEAIALVAALEDM